MADITDPRLIRFSNRLMVVYLDAVHAVALRKRGVGKKANHLNRAEALALIPNDSSVVIDGHGPADEGITGADVHAMNAALNQANTRLNAAGVSFPIPDPS